MTSYGKRNRLSQQNRNTGTVANPPETDQLIVGDSTKEAVIDDSTINAQPPCKLSLNLNQPNAHNDSTGQASTSDTSNSQPKNKSKAELRHLFFLQISSNDSNGAAIATTTNAAAEPTPNLASSRGD